jgi:hypothetical protein
LKSCAVAGRLFHGSTNTLGEEKLARVNSTLFAEQLKAMATRIMFKIDVQEKLISINVDKTS